MATRYHARYKTVDDLDSHYRIFASIVGHLWNLKGEAEMAELAKASGVHQGTLYNWKNGTVITPRIDTLTKVARALGYEIVLKRTRKAPLRAVK